jgi:hypothetical protein
MIPIINPASSQTISPPQPRRPGSHQTPPQLVPNASLQSPSRTTVPHQYNLAAHPRQLIHRTAPSTAHRCGFTGKRCAETLPASGSPSRRRAVVRFAATAIYGTQHRKPGWRGQLDYRKRRGLWLWYVLLLFRTAPVSINTGRLPFRCRSGIPDGR